jgi:cytidylate kinase
MSESTAAAPGVPADDAPEPLVTISGLFGTGHRVVGAKVAELLGVQLVDRVLAEDVARATGLSDSAVWASEGGQSRVAGVLNRLSNAFGTVGASGSPYSSEMTEATYRLRVERHLARARFRGGVVIGRGGMVVLHDVPWALHVGLYGPQEARLEQEIGFIRPHLSRSDARDEQRRVDRDRVAYLRNAYHVDHGDPANYDLMLDSTALDLDVVARTVAELAREQLRRSTRGTRTDEGGIS